MLRTLRRRLDKQRLRNPDYAFLFEPDQTGELVAIDCETTGLNPRTDHIISIAAVKIRDTEVLTSERLELLVRPPVSMTGENVAIHRLRPIDLAEGLEIMEALDRLLRFVGSRPLVGYYLKFDVAMVDKYLKRLVGFALPNKRIEVSSMYYDRVVRRHPGRYVDLTFNHILTDLGLPQWAQHDAFNDALMAALIYLKLTHGRLDHPRRIWF